MTDRLGQDPADAWTGREAQYPNDGVADGGEETGERQGVVAATGGTA